jgi:2-haloacid dehalogenase
MTVLQDIDAAVFDAYGTLFDVASSAQRHAARLGPDWKSFAELWRRKQLEYSWLRSMMGAHTDFWHVTGESLDYALASFKRQDPALRTALMASYLALDAYPDVRPTLARLRAAGKRTATLSNGAPSMLIAAIGSARLAELLEPPISVEAVRVFKPDARVYQLAVDRLGIEKTRILFVSANGWDAAAAAQFGFRTAWINRLGAPRDLLPGAPDVVIAGVGDVPALLGL